QAITDKQGRYRLVGLPSTTRQALEVLPAPSQPYLTAIKPLAPSGGSEPAQIDAELKRGVAIQGRVTEKDTGKPVRAEVHCLALPDNPNVHDAPGFQGSRPPAVFSAEDGSFTLIGLPGRGVVAAKAVGSAQGRYLTAAGAEAIKGAEREYLFFSYP